MVRRILLASLAAASVAALLVGTRARAPMAAPVAKAQTPPVDPVQVWHDVATELSGGAIKASDLAAEVRVQPLGLGDAVRRMSADEIALPGGRAVLRRGELRLQSGPVKFSFETSSIRAGEATLYEPRRGDRKETLRLGDNLAVRRGELLEYYRAVGGELEQIFVVNARPPAGDLVIEGRARTNQKLLSADEGRLRFGRQSETTLTIDRAVAVDASGRSTAVAMNYDHRGHRLTMTVPSAWMESASYPVLVDPTIGTPFAMTAGAISANGLHHAQGGKFLVASGASSQFRSAADGSTVGSAVPVAFYGDMVYGAASGLFCYAYTTLDDDAEDCIGVRLLNPADNSVSAEVTMAVEPDTLSVDYDFWTATVAPISTGWVVSFNVNWYDWDLEINAWQMRSVRVANDGTYSAGPVLLREDTWTDVSWDDHDWDWYGVNSCSISAAGADRVCATWGDYGYIDTLEGADYYAAFAAVVDAGTMTVLRDWIVESDQISYAGDSWAAVEEATCSADDANDQFLVAWERANYDGWYSIKAHRYGPTGSGLGSDFYVKGSGGSSGPDYYLGDMVWSPLGSEYSAAASCHFVTFNTGGNVYGAVVNGGVSAVAANDIAVAATASAEASYRMALNPADTRILVQVTIGGVASGQLFELKNVPPPVVITTSALPAGTVNVAYGATLTSTGGLGSPVWTMTGNPTWLELNSATGQLTGVPTGTGSITLQITCTDGSVGTKTLTLNINAAPGGSTGGSGGGGGGGGCSAGGSPGNLLPILAALLIVGLVRAARRTA